MKILHYRTTGETAPNASNLELGEIAMSTSNVSPRLFFKKEDNTIGEVVDKNKVLTFDTTQTLSSDEQAIVTENLGIMDERVELKLTCSPPIKISDVTITVKIADEEIIYSWKYVPITFIVPMFTEYTISFQNIDGYDAPEKITRIAQRNCHKVFNLKYTKNTAIDLSLRDIENNIMSGRTTANCYIIYSKNTYCFPLVYGCSIRNDEEYPDSYWYDEEKTNTRPFYNYLNEQITSPYIEKDTGVNIASGEVLYYDVSGFTIENIKIIDKSCKYLQFTVSNFPKTGGNAVIAIKDASGQIMWSWHIWAAFDDTIGNHGTHINERGNHYEIMRYPLGYVKSDITGTCTYYQWGRKDPVLRAQIYSSQTTNAITYPSDAFTFSKTYAKNIAESIQNPTTIYQGNQTKQSWWCDYEDGGDQVYYINYWNPSHYGYESIYSECYKSVYDPCPRDYCVPNYKAFIGLSAETTTWDDGYVIGRYVKRLFGQRLYNYVSSLNSDAKYWCSMPPHVRYKEWNTYWPTYLYFRRKRYYETYNPLSVNLPSEYDRCLAIIPVKWL